MIVLQTEKPMVIILLVSFLCFLSPIFPSFLFSLLSLLVSDVIVTFNPQSTCTRVTVQMSDILLCE